MSEWWTYRPSDFLLFAPRTYYRLVETYNAESWPWQAVALAAALGKTALDVAKRPGRTGGPERAADQAADFDMCGQARFQVAQPASVAA